MEEMLALSKYSQVPSLLEQVMICCRQIRTVLGGSHLECVYHRALEVELRHQGICYESEVIVAIVYRGQFVGSARVDMVVEKELVVELKAVQKLLASHEAQVSKYMHLLKLEKGLLVNMAGGKDGAPELVPLKLNRE